MAHFRDERGEVQNGGRFSFVRYLKGWGSLPTLLGHARDTDINFANSLFAPGEDDETGAFLRSFLRENPQHWKPETALAGAL